MTPTDVPLNDDGTVMENNAYDVLDEHGVAALPTEPPPYLRFSENPPST